MSIEKQGKEARRWLEQADADLKAADGSIQQSSYEWSCFQCQQAAEKALKAVWFHRGLDPWGHSVMKLIDEFPKEDDWSEILSKHGDDASDLDKLYIPTRYPNGLPEYTPHQVYREKDARAATANARAILNTVHSLIAPSL